MKITRRKFIVSMAGLSVLAGAGGIARCFIEPEWFEVTEKTIDINYFSKPLKILHLSDFHVTGRSSLKNFKKAIDLSISQKPDIAFLTGDYITWKLTEESGYRRILKKLTTITPTFACIGNHDGGKWAGSSHGYRDFSKVKDFLLSSNINFLFNESVTVNIKGKEFTVVGLGDLWSGDLKPRSVLKKQRDKNIPIFVLSHNPDSKSDLKDYDWDLLCCGHTHGGQLVIPFIRSRPFLPVVDKSFPEGILSWGDKHIHITRGTGDLHGMRFNCRPEISLLNIK